MDGKMVNPLSTMPEGEPVSVVAGDTWVWQHSDLSTDYPLASYSLSYALQREGDTGAPWVFVATEVGNAYQVMVLHTVTANKVAGTYKWTAYATRTSDSARVAIGSGLINVLPNPAAAFDARSHAVKVLAAIEALIEGRATTDVNSYSIAGRSLTRMSVDELLSWRAHYRREVQRDRNAANAASGLPTGRTRVVRF